MASIKVKRKNAKTKQEKTFNSLKEAAEKSGCSVRTIREAIQTGRVSKGFYWEVAGRKKEWQPWMVDYIKKNYTGRRSLPDLAAKTGKTEREIEGKVKYLGLRVKPIEETDYKMMDAVHHKSKIKQMKQQVHIGSKVKVELYIDDLEDGGNRVMKVFEALVVGCYECFANVMINGIRRSYSWDDILAVIEE